MELHHCTLFWVKVRVRYGLFGSGTYSSHRNVSRTHQVRPNLKRTTWPIGLSRSGLASVGGLVDGTLLVRRQQIWNRYKKVDESYMKMSHELKC